MVFSIAHFLGECFRLADRTKNNLRFLSVLTVWFYQSTNKEYRIFQTQTRRYCWWKKSCTSWYVLICSLSQGLIHPNGGCLGFLNHQHCTKSGEHFYLFLALKQGNWGYNPPSWWQSHRWTWTKWVPLSKLEITWTGEHWTPVLKPPQWIRFWCENVKFAKDIWLDILLGIASILYNAISKIYIPIPYLEWPSAIFGVRIPLLKLTTFGRFSQPAGVWSL